MDGKRDHSPGPDHAGVAFHPPLLLLLAIVVGFLARWLLPLSMLPDAVARASGPVLTVAPFALFLWAVYTMRSVGASIPTSKSTDVIVVRGPYRFSRNPIYLAMLFLQLGIGVWANSLWFFVLAVICVPLFAWGVISREERYLERKFGDGYLTYKARVRRWL